MNTKKKNLVFAALIASAIPSALSQTYVYDDANRLTDVIYADGTGIRYTYDQASNITSVIPTFAPAAATGVAAIATEENRASIQWEDNATNESGFQIQRREEGSDEWTVLGTVPANTTNYLDNTVNLNDDFYYRVQALAGQASSAYSQEVASPSANTGGGGSGTGNVTGDALLVNISIRGQVGTGDNVMLAGFVIDGEDPMNVLIRAVSDSLDDVNGNLEDSNLSVLDLNGGLTVIEQNDNWGDAQNVAEIKQAFVDTGADTRSLPDNSKDSAALLELDPGVYAALITGVNDTTGITLVEVYDASPGTADSRLINISTRLSVGAGDDVLIGGFVIDGDEPREVLIRALGPALSGVQGTINDPQLTLFSGADVVASNDDWDEGGNAAQISAAEVEAKAQPRLQAGALDSAILVTLEPGIYGAVLTGVKGATGVALIEIYELK